jgi:GTP-binding protein Era
MGSEFKSGYVAIAGPPNAGKSTLLNRLLGQKVSITSKKPQTTRNRILGVLHRPSSQIVFLDTPGVHQPRDPLNTRIVDVALSALGDADIVVLVIDAAHPDPASEHILVKKLGSEPRPVILALNKIDLVTKPNLLATIDRWSRAFAFEAVVPISAMERIQIDDLVTAMEAILPQGPPFFPADTITDLPKRFMAAEIVREKVFRLTGEEIPYATAVTVDSFKEEQDGRLIAIHATIHLERESQKAIVIGKAGSKLKRIGTDARKELEQFLETKVFLRLFVRVQKNWRRDTRALRRFGY